MNFPTFELREVKPARKILLQGDTINLENVLTKSVSSGIFQKTKLTLKLKTGETLTYEVDQKELDEVFKK